MCLNNQPSQSKPKDMDKNDAVFATLTNNTNSTTNKKMRILLCSENVPPQVNGIARRVGHYADGLRKMGCEVDLLHPESGFDKVISHVNPWNFTARMMVIVPLHLLKLVANSDPPYDVIHVVLPLNLSGMWILAAFQILRSFSGSCSSSTGSSRQQQPTLVCSWHCNMYNYIQCHVPSFIRPLFEFSFFGGLCGILPYISDRILTPTRATDPKITSMWKGRAGVCETGIQMGKGQGFSPCNKNSKWGLAWTESKQAFLQETGNEFLLVCVGRLSPEKGIDELIKVLASSLKGCSLWLVGDGPHKAQLKLLAKELNAPVQFLGYQKGEALHAAYAVADVFVCPSLTETFGQTVNEALASKVRVALPSVPVFVEAYGHAIPEDAFWEPMDRQSMANAILKQTERQRTCDAVGMPDLDKLKTWDQACEDLYMEYEEASKNHYHLPFTAALFLPLWYIVTFFTAICTMYLAFVRTLFGGSARFYFSTKTKGSTKKIRDSMKNIKDKIQKVSDHQLQQ